MPGPEPGPVLFRRPSHPDPTLPGYIGAPPGSSRAVIARREDGRPEDRPDETRGHLIPTPDRSPLPAGDRVLGVGRGEGNWVILSRTGDVVARF